MKYPFLISLSAAFCFSTLYGIERPKALDVEQAVEDAEEVDNGIKEKRGEGAPRALPENKRRGAAWLGVLTKPVSETLKAHLDVEDGVVLDYVAPDSPASRSGLRQHDILLSVAGKKVSSQQDLRDRLLYTSPSPRDS